MEKIIALALIIIWVVLVGGIIVDKISDPDPTCMDLTVGGFNNDDQLVRIGHQVVCADKWWISSVRGPELPIVVEVHPWVPPIGVE